MPNSWRDKKTMKKIFSTVILLFVLLLSSCGRSEEAPQITVPADTSEQSADQVPEPETLKEPDIETAVLPDAGTDTFLENSIEEEPSGYQKIYTQTVAENTDSYTSFSLIYLNDDDIPEMVVYNSYYEKYSIYTVEDNTLFCLADSLNTVELTYYEQTGILCGFARWNGGGDEGGYGSYYYQIAKDKTLTDDDTPILNFTYNAVYDENGIYTGEGVTAYYYMGQETNEATYTEMESRLGISENAEKVCYENAVDKEEMLALLSASTT